MFYMKAWATAHKRWSEKHLSNKQNISSSVKVSTLITASFSPN